MKVYLSYILMITLGPTLVVEWRALPGMMVSLKIAYLDQFERFPSDPIGNCLVIVLTIDLNHFHSHTS